MARLTVRTTVNLIAWALILSGCVTSPTTSFDQKARLKGLSSASVSTSQFDLKIYANAVKNSEFLHIYIEGDGRPFFRNSYVNLDPTSIRAVTLDLIAQDSTQAVIVGRPCYHNPISRGCDDSKWWTSHRYSDEVLSAMVDAVHSVNTDNKPLRLFGFSGGGAIATLAAAKLDKMDHLITINANLNINAWTAQHSYTPLFGSLNPIDFLDLIAHVKQTHLVGAKDKNVDASQWLNAVQKHSNASAVEYEKFDHLCCWSTIWSDVLEPFNEN